MVRVNRTSINVDFDNEKIDQSGLKYLQPVGAKDEPVDAEKGLLKALRSCVIHR